MAYDPKPGSFSLFKNQQKQSDNHPDYSGDGKDLNGNAVYVSAWLKEGKSGKFMSCSFKLKEAKPKNEKVDMWKELDDSLHSPPF
jgi:hypothetical protein